MRHQDIDELYREAVRAYRPPPPVPVEALWARIEREAFDRPGGRGAAWARWIWRVAPLAAAAALGVVVGRSTARHARPGTVVASTVAAEALGPVPDDYLDRTTALLVALPSQASAPDRRLVAQARELLSTTRLLLDSPSLVDAEYVDLLEDLELVLVQIARLPAASAEEDMHLINEALEDHDVMARLRTVTLASSRPGL